MLGRVSEEITQPSVLSRHAAGAWTTCLPSWPWIVGLLAMLRALGSPLALLHDPDTYMHIAAGRWMLAHRALPLADPFSFTMAGAHWAPSEWLGEIILAAVYGLARWGGTIVLTAACFGFAIGLLTWFLLRRLEPLPAVIAALAGAVLVLPHLLARPHVIALPLMVLWCGGVIAARDDSRGPPWFVLPAMLLWANLHGSFLFGIALAGYLSGEAVLSSKEWSARFREARRWGGFVIAAIAVSLLTPNGLTALVQPFRLMAMPALQAGFGEWQQADLAAFPVLGLWLAGAAVLVVLARRQMAWTRLVLLLGLAYMALAHVRHADLLGLVGPLAVASALGPRLKELLRPAAASPLLRGAALLARSSQLPGRLLILAVAVIVSLPVLLRPIDRSADAVTPQAALDAARRLDLTGPVFNSEAFGGYLIFSGVPTFIDGRIELYGNDFLAAYLNAERGDTVVLAGLLDRYHIAWALLQTASPAVAALDRVPGWRRVYGDDRAVVYRRGD
jgi:hypothetical protein